LFSARVGCEILFLDRSNPKQYEGRSGEDILYCIILNNRAVSGCIVWKIYWGDFGSVYTVLAYRSVKWKYILLWLSACVSGILYFSCLLEKYSF
jgi:hypothetical protein